LGVGGFERLSTKPYWHLKDFLQKLVAKIRGKV